MGTIYICGGGDWGSAGGAEWREAMRSQMPRFLAEATKSQKAWAVGDQVRVAAAARAWEVFK